MDRIVHMIMRRLMRMMIAKASKAGATRAGVKRPLNGSGMGHTRHALKVLRRSTRL